MRVTTVTTTSGDTQATRAEVEVQIERAETDGVETIVLLGEGEIRNIAFFEAAPDFTYLVPNGDRITDWQSIPPDGLQDGTRVLSSQADIRPGVDPVLDECIAAVGDALGVEVKHTSELAEGEANYYSGTENSCVRMSMFIQIAEAAGPDLTTDSWVAALDTVQDLRIPGYQFFSLSSAKPDANDQLKLVEYNLATLSFDDLTDYTEASESFRVKAKVENFAKVSGEQRTLPTQFIDFFGGMLGQLVQRPDDLG